MYPLDNSGTPYYDLTTDEISKSYIGVLARPGFKIQSRELAVMQGFVSKNIKDIGDLIAKDGTIVSGCELVTKLTNNPMTVSVSAGRVYIDGHVWDVPELAETSIGVPPASLLSPINIDVVLTEVIVTEDDDDTLKSPAENFSAFNLPGAHRRKVTAEFELNSSNGVTIYRLIQGSPLKLPTSSAFSQLEPTLARRTYDAHDHFLVTGMSIVAEGDDELSFESEPQVKPVSGTLTASIVPGTTSHPYGPAFTNRVTCSSAPFTHDDIGRRLVLQSGDFEGNYDILDVISPTEIEVDAEFVGSSDPAIDFVIKETPQAIKCTVNAGKSYVLGFEVLKPISTVLSISKALTGRDIINEPKSTTFREFEYSLNRQPFNSLASEGITTDSYLGLGMVAGESGLSTSVPGPIRQAVAFDDLGAFIGSSSLVDIVAVASAAATWNWHPDPDDGAYPGVFTGGVLYAESATNGWQQSGNLIVWAGGAGDKPSTGSAYKVLAVVTKSLTRGTDYRVKSNASATMYQLPGESTSPVTNDDLFFPQETYDLDTQRELVFTVDGTTVAVDFFNHVLVSDITDVDINTVVSVINDVANDAGVPNVATAQYESIVPPKGWIILKSPTTGSNSVITVTSGNTVLGFPTNHSVSGSDSPTDVISFGGYRAFTLFAQPPYSSYSFDADYKQGLYRRDLVVLDRDGLVSVLEGEPDVLEKVAVRGGFVSTLSLGSLQITPMSSIARVTNYENLRTTMPELRKVISRVENIEHDLSVLDLDREAIGSENPSNLSSVFSDGFVGFSKADLTYADATPVTYSVSLDIIDKEISLPFDEEENVLVIDEPATDPDIDLTHNSLVYLPMTDDDAEIISQTNATEFITLNQFSAYTTQPRIQLSPSFENYLDSSKNHSIQETDISFSKVNSWIKARTTEDLSETQAGEFNLRVAGSTGLNERPSSKRVTVETSDKILELSRPIIRSREVTITGRGFLQNESDIRVKFDGISLDALVATVGTVNGDGTVDADTHGRFTATFMIPANQGKKTAHTVTALGGIAGSVSATTTYRTWYWDTYPPEDVYHSEKKGFIPRMPVVENTFASLAQTFTLTRDTILTGISVYFQTIDSTRPITVQVRNVENNVPGSISYAEEVLAPTNTSDLQTSLHTSTNGTSPKFIRFRDPIFIRANQEYAIVMNSPGTGYKVAIARVGETDLVTSQLVSQQPFSVGRILTSPNATDWSVQDDADLKFILHGAKYVTDTPSELVFESIVTAGDFTRFILVAESAEMSGSKVSWFFSVDGGSTYLPVVPLVLTEAGSSPSVTFNEILFKAVLETTDENASPILLKDSISVHTRLLVLEGDYITKRTELSAGNTYNEVKQTLKVNPGAGGVAQPYYGYTDPDTNAIVWVQSEEDDDSPAIALEDGFTRVFYRTPSPALDSPDFTSPASITGSVTPSAINPTFDTTGGSNSFTLRVVYWKTDLTIATTDISITVTSGATTPAATIVTEINADTAAAIGALAVGVTTFNVASLDEFNRIVLTHPQSFGQQRNALTIVTDGSAGLGFTISDGDVGGSITGAVLTGGSLSFSPDPVYYYTAVGTDGIGYTQNPANDQDTVKLTTSAGNQRTKLTFAEDSLDPDTSTVVIFRGQGSFGSITWKRLAEVTVEDLFSSILVAGTGYTTQNGDFIEDGTNAGTTVPLPPTDVVARKQLTDYRGRINLVSSLAGATPRVREFTNNFVRPLV